MAATTFETLMEKSREELAAALTDLLIERAIRHDVEAAYRPEAARAAAEVERLHGALVEELCNQRDHWLNEAWRLREASARHIGSKGGKARHQTARWYAKQIARLYVNKRSAPPSRMQVARAIVDDVAKLAREQGSPLSPDRALMTVDGWIKEAIEEGEIDASLIMARPRK